MDHVDIPLSDLLTAQVQENQCTNYVNTDKGFFHITLRQPIHNLNFEMAPNDEKVEMLSSAEMLTRVRYFRNPVFCSINLKLKRIPHNKLSFK
jgi:hypothetical protein